MKKYSRKKYNTIKIKSKIFLTNISYNYLIKRDYEYTFFILDSFSFIQLNFDLSNLERKFIENNELDFIKTLWETCIPCEIFEFINQKEILMKLIKLFLKYTTANGSIKKILKIIQRILAY